jgi:hypothetical protein
MTKAEANRILDRARMGENVSELEITRALRVTGDIEFGQPIQRLRPAGSWEKHAEPRFIARATWTDGLIA